jgi:hypothetical protein
MEQTGCTKLLHAAEATPIAKQLKDMMPYLHISTVPAFDKMMASTPKYYPYDKSFDECHDEPVVVLHSSGSTGRFLEFH